MFALKLLIGLLSTLALVAAEPIPSPSDTVPPVGDRGGLAIETTGTPINEAKPNPPAAPPQDGNYPAIRLHIPDFALVEKKTKGAYVGPASTTWKSFGQTITALQFDKLYKADPFTRADLTVTTYQHDNDWEKIRADQLDETKKKKLPLPKEAAKHQCTINANKWSGTEEVEIQVLEVAPWLSIAESSKPFADGLVVNCS